MSTVDLRLLRAKELIETAIRDLNDAIEKKEKGDPYAAGGLSAAAAKLLKEAVEIIESTAKPHH